MREIARRSQCAGELFDDVEGNRNAHKPLRRVGALRVTPLPQLFRVYVSKSAYRTGAETKPKATRVSMSAPNRSSARRTVCPPRLR